jgi:D-3-phosphoglycerate dehydrogenase/(S)-sulfolactate dehydrogenase
MDLLIVEPIETEVLRWLQARHRVTYAPELARDPRTFRQKLFNVRAALLPPQLRVDTQTLAFAPLLRAVGRIGQGPENADADACAKAGVEIVRGQTATAPAEAEFIVGALLTMMRPSPEGERLHAGRELASSTVGFIGMTQTARSLSAVLRGFGCRLVGYDPTLHSSDVLWGRWRVEPMGLRELLETADAACVLLPYFSRYTGLLGERYLAFSKPGQLMVSVGHSALFNEYALALALRTARISAVWFDSPEPGLFDPGRPLHGLPGVITTPRLAGYTQEARVRSAWAVAQRIDEILSNAPTTARDFRPSAPMPLNSAALPGDPEGDPPDDPPEAPQPDSGEDCALSPDASAGFERVPASS